MTSTGNRLAVYVRALDDEPLCALLANLPPAVFLDLLAAAYPNVIHRKAGEAS